MRLGAIILAGTMLAVVLPLVPRHTEAAPRGTAAAPRGPHTTARLKGGAVSVPVLTYHHLLPRKELERNPAWAGNPYVVAAEDFAAQLDLLRRLGFSTIDTAALAAFLEDRAPLPPKPVLITFDDGYQSVYQYAYPALAERHMKATVFVIAGLVSQEEEPFDAARLQYLSWGQVAAMSRSGVIDVQSHTYLMHGSGRESPLAAAPDAPALRDLILARHVIAQHTGREPVALAFPHGIGGRRLARLAAAAGYRIAFTAGSHRLLTPSAPRYALPRITIGPRTPLLAVLRRYRS